MKLRVFDAHSVTIASLNSAIDESGYVIIRKALNKGDLAQIRKELEPHFEKRADSKAIFFGYNTKRIEALFTKSHVAQKIAVHPLVLGVMDHVLGPNCDSYQI